MNHAHRLSAFSGFGDVVAAFGIPIDLGPLKFHRVNLGYKLALPENVTYCCHAIALDEQRKAFRITRVENGYEVWFRGVHSDVGGGNQNEALSNIALAWMLRKAAFAGLPVDATIAAQLAINAAYRSTGKSFDRRLSQTQDNGHDALLGGSTKRSLSVRPAGLPG